MQAISTVETPDRPGKTSAWTAFRSPGKYDARVRPASVRPSAVSVGTLDQVRSALWQSYRHLFPPHALAAQTPSGSIVVSWSIQDEPQARYPYAAPLTLRFDERLVDAMSRADHRQRIRIAQEHEAKLRDGLRGYDPCAPVPGTRVVNIG